jgi:hypothetical protein
MQVKALPGQGLVLTRVGVWGSAAVRGGMTAGVEAVGWGLPPGAGLAAGDPDGAGDRAGLDPGLVAGAELAGAGLAGAGLAVAPLVPALAAADGDAAGAVAGTAG